MCDRTGIIDISRDGLTGHKLWLAEHTNQEHITGSLEDAIKGADVLVGVSGPGIVTEEMVASMNKDAILFAMANPGRSDFPNQINNVLAFPGIFRGALDARASRITESMKVAAAYAIADLVSAEELNEDYVMPSPFDKRVAPAVAKAVYDAWMKEVK